jgi:hypothetical protein
MKSIDNTLQYQNTNSFGIGKGMPLDGKTQIHGSQSLKMSN